MRFDARTGAARLGPVPINRAGFTSLMITSDGRRLVAVGDGETVVRDAQDLRVLKRWPVGRRGASPYRPTALAPDDRTVAIGGQDGSVRLLDLDTGRQRTALDRHAAEVFGTRFTPDGRFLVSTGADGDVILWDVKRAAASETLSGQPGPVLSPQITRDSRTLYTAGPGAAVFIWDLVGTRRLGRPFTTGAPSSRPGLAVVSPGPAFLALSADGRLIAKGQDDGAINVIDAHTLVPHEALPDRNRRPRARPRLRARQPPLGRDRQPQRARAARGVRLRRARRRRPRTRARADRSGRDGPTPGDERRWAAARDGQRLRARHGPPVVAARPHAGGRPTPVRPVGR